MTNEQKKINKELLIILDKLNYIDKIPNEIINNLKNNQDDSWKFEYDDNVPLEKQKIHRRTAVLLSDLYLMFICNDDREKESLIKIYRKNEEKNKNINYNEMLKNVGNKSNVVRTELPSVQLEDSSFFSKIKRLLAIFFGTKNK